MSSVRYQVLGPVRAFRGSAELAIGPVRQRAVLVVLLLRSGITCSTTEIIAAVWGHRPPPTGIGLVRTYISRLRRVLGRDAIISDPAGYRMRVGPSELDVAWLEDLLSSPGRWSAGDRTWALLDGAGAEPLDGIPGPFAQAQRVRLVGLRAAALEAAFDAELSAGPPARIVPRLRAAVAVDPTRERLVGLLMTALYRSGRQADALTCYRELRERLVAGPPAMPGEELTALHEAVLRSDAALRARRPGDDRAPADAIPPELRRLVDDAAVAQRRGDYRDAAAQLNRAQRIADGCGQAGALSLVHTARARLCCEQGRYRDGLVVARDGLAHANRLDDRRHAAAALQVLGDLDTALGSLDTAHEHLSGARAAALDAGVPQLAALALAGLGTLAQHRGDLTAALGLHEQAAGVLADTETGGGDPAPVSVELGLRAAETRHAAGDRAQAEALLRSCLELAEYRGELHGTARALGALARCLPAGSEAQLYAARAAAIQRRLDGHGPEHGAGPHRAVSVNGRAAG